LKHEDRANLIKKDLTLFIKLKYEDKRWFSNNLFSTTDHNRQTKPVVRETKDNSFGNFDANFEMAFGSSNSKGFRNEFANSDNKQQTNDLNFDFGGHDNNFSFNSNKFDTAVCRGDNTKVTNNLNPFFQSVNNCNDFGRDFVGNVNKNFFPFTTFN